MPVIGFLSTRSPEDIPNLLAAFRRGLAENGYVEGQNVTIARRGPRGMGDNPRCSRPRGLSYALEYSRNIEASPWPRNPMRAIFARCCARAASGQPAAAPPSVNMNSRLRLRKADDITPASPA
jgi:hypothetical protein